MYEIKDDILYKEYSIYKDSVIDYFIIKSDKKVSHKEVVLFALKIFNERNDFDFTYDESKMKEKKNNKNDLFNENYNNLFLKPPFGTPSLK